MAGLEPMISLLRVQCVNHSADLPPTVFAPYTNVSLSFQHEAISAFLTQHFYNGRLVSGREELSKASTLKFWPGGRNKPISFVHVFGCEHAVCMPTAEGPEQSKCNMEEVSQAVS